MTQPALPNHNLVSTVRPVQQHYTDGRVRTDSKFEIHGIGGSLKFQAQVKWREGLDWQFYLTEANESIISPHGLTCKQCVQWSGILHKKVDQTLMAELSGLRIKRTQVKNFKTELTKKYAALNLHSDATANDDGKRVDTHMYRVAARVVDRTGQVVCPTTYTDVVYNPQKYGVPTPEEIWEPAFGNPEGGALTLALNGGGTDPMSKSGRLFVVYFDENGEMDRVKPMRKKAGAIRVLYPGKALLPGETTKTISLRLETEYGAISESIEFTYRAPTSTSAAAVVPRPDQTTCCQNRQADFLPTQMTISVDKLVNPTDASDTMEDISSSVTPHGEEEKDDTDDEVEEDQYQLSTMSSHYGKNDETSQDLEWKERDGLNVRPQQESILPQAADECEKGGTKVEMQTDDNFKRLLYLDIQRTNNIMDTNWDSNLNTPPGSYTAPAQPEHTPESLCTSLTSVQSIDNSPATSDTSDLFKCYEGNGSALVDTSTSVGGPSALLPVTAVDQALGTGLATVSPNPGLAQAPVGNATTTAWLNINGQMLPITLGLPSATLCNLQTRQLPNQSPPDWMDPSGLGAAAGGVPPPLFQGGQRQVEEPQRKRVHTETGADRTPAKKICDGEPNGEYSIISQPTDSIEKPIYPIPDLEDVDEWIFSEYPELEEIASEIQCNDYPHPQDGDFTKPEPHQDMPYQRFNNLT